MRGALNVGKLALVVLGIIPADAGSTRKTALVLLRPRDHPRGCGEHDLFCTPDGLVGGSSPRMRGARDQTIHIVHHIPIIPADAGSTR